LIGAASLIVQTTAVKLFVQLNVTAPILISASKSSSKTLSAADIWWYVTLNFVGIVPVYLARVLIAPEENSLRIVGSINLVSLNPRCDTARVNVGKDAIFQISPAAAAASQISNLKSQILFTC